MRQKQGDSRQVRLKESVWKRGNGAFESWAGHKPVVSNKLETCTVLCAGGALIEGVDRAIATVKPQSKTYMNSKDR